MHPDLGRNVQDPIGHEDSSAVQNQYLEKRKTSLYSCMEKACLDCRSRLHCPSLIVIAMRYAPEIAANRVSGG
jgi:hypothetical protein